MEPKRITFAIVSPSGEVSIRHEHLTVGTIRSITGVGKGRYDTKEGPDGTTVYLDEVASERGGVYNWVATTWLRPMLHPADTIHGTVVVVGPPESDLDGHPGDLAPDTVDSLRMTAASFIHLQSLVGA